MTSVPIDIVFTWVDGDDPHSADALKQFLQENSSENPLDQLAGQLRDLEELRYSLRSVTANMPWFRRIYVVTNGQAPSYINFKSERIQLVKHEEIFSDTNDLPVFNSLAIECHLHRIPGLCDYFMYFNNDCFVGKPVAQDEIIDRNGHEEFFLDSPSIPSDATIHKHIRLLNHSNNLLDGVFGPATRLNTSHTPQIYNKKVCEDVSSLWKADLIITSKSRFRRSDICFFRYLYTYYSINRFYPDRDLVDILRDPTTNVKLVTSKDCVFGEVSTDEQKLQQTIELLRSDDPTYFCIQDHMWADFNKGKEALKSFLGDRFPIACTWEADISTQAESSHMRASVCRSDVVEGESVRHPL